MVSVVTSVRSLAVDAGPDLVHQIVDLVARLAHVHVGVDDPGRTHDLLDDPARVAALVLARRGRHEHELGRDREELLERLGTVVERAGQAEPVVDERLLAGAVALVHAADLRHGLVRLVDEADEIVREVVEQAVRAVPRLAAIEDPRVVLDPRAEPQLAEHLHVVLGPLAQPVGLEQLALRLELGAPLVQLPADLGDRVLDHPLAHVVVRRGPDPDVLDVVLDHLAGERVELLQLLDLVAEQHHAVGRLRVGGKHLEGLASDPECPPPERGVVARVLDRDQLAQQPVAVDELALAERLQVLVVRLRRAQTVDAGHAGHDQHVPAREQRSGGRMAQPIDLLVDRRVLLDVQVLARDVRLGLVVVVVGDEVLDRVAGKYVRNSLHSWAASVLLWAITSAGFCTRSTTPAIVIVLPVPVAPSTVRNRSPASTPAAIESIAAG